MAIGHIKALEYLSQKRELFIVNLGTGRGSSVLEVVKAFAKASGREVPYKLVPRRSGDVATCFANCDLAYKLLGFSTKFDLAKMCIDTWKWQSKNPNGFK